MALNMVVFELTEVGGAVLEEKEALTFSFVVFEGAFVNLSIFILFLSLPRNHTIFKVTFENVTIRINESAFAVWSIVEPVAFVS